MTVKNLGNEKDVQKSQNITEGGGRSFLKLDQATNFMVIVSLDYADGFFHFVTIGKAKRNIICKAGLDGRGFAPEDCPKCEEVMQGYEEAKKLKKAGEKAESEAVKKEANSLRASYQMYVAAIKGDVIIVKEHGKKLSKPDFDDVDKIGVWALTDSQKKILLGLIDDPDVEKIQKGDDLAGVVLKVKREKTGYKKVTDMIPVGKLNLDKMELGDLPDIASLVEMPENYEEAVEKLEESLVEEEEEDDPDEVELKKPESSKTKSRRKRR